MDGRESEKERGRGAKEERETEIEGERAGPLMHGS